MTLEALLDCDADTLEAMSDEELLKHFSQYLNITRPELAPRQQRQLSVAPKQAPLQLDAGTALAAKELAKLGVDISHLFKPQNKRK